MVRDNKWRSGGATISHANWPTALDGPPGPRLLRAMFTPEFGCEVYIGLVEDRDFALLLRCTQGVQLLCKFGLVETSHGKVIFVLFRLADAKENLSEYELYLNPHEPDTALLLEAWADQTHLKLLVIDNAEKEVVTFWEYPNNHPLAGLAAEAMRIASEGLASDVKLTSAEVQRRFSLQDLWSA